MSTTDLTEILSHIERERSGKKFAFVSGNFNILHPGHLRLMRFARECADFLVVGVLDSHSPGAVVDEDLRLESVNAISWVDHAFILRLSPEKLIRKLKPHFVIKGKEHEDRHNSEAAALADTGGKLLFGSGEMSFSSIDLLRREWQEFIPSTIVQPKGFAARHDFDGGNLLAALEKMSQLRVGVIGDTIVDEYVTCDPLGMSQEDPTIVVTPIARERFIGGAAIVAAHARGIGSSVHFFSVLGEDETADFVRESLADLDVNFHAYRDRSRPTTLKQRYNAGRKTLLRVSHLRQHEINADIRTRMSAEIREVLGEIDLLIFADYNYGCLHQAVVDGTVEEGVRRGIVMVADSQSSSQVGDVSRFKGMLLLTPTEREARLATQDFNSGLVILASTLRERAMARNVIVTLGEEGLLIHAETSEENQWLTDRLPALNSAPKDVSGAGDSLLTTSSMALAAGCDIWQSSYLGALAAACQVGRVGNIPITRREMEMEIEN